MAKTIPYRYKAQVIRWVDGDTVDVLLDLGLTVIMKLRFRLYGINTNEINAADPALRKKGQEALEFNKKWAPEGSWVAVDTYKPDKYGRWLGVFSKLATDEKNAKMTTNEKPLNDLLVESKLAAAYFGEGVKSEVQ